LRRRLRVTAVTRIALTLVAVAAIAAAISIVSSRFDNWAPNIATEALSIAVTVAVVERIVDRSRKAPLVERTLAHMKAEFARLVVAVALDYASTHRARAIPRDALALLRQWLDDQDTADLPHMPLPPDEETLRDQAREFVRQVEQYEHRDKDMLEPDLRAAMRDLWGSLQHSEYWERQMGHTVAPKELVDPERLSYRALIGSAHAFGEVLRRYAPASLFEVPEYAIEWAEQVRHERFSEDT
jgi:hypothetical protein